MWPNPQENADLVTFTEEILKGKFGVVSTVGEFTSIYRNTLK